MPRVGRIPVIITLVATAGVVSSSAEPLSAAAADGCLPVNGLMNLNDADAVMSGTVRVSSATTVRIGTGDVDWNRTGLQTPDARSLYSLKWVEELVREHRRSGETAYLDRAVDLVLDFVADNPPEAGPDPIDSWYPMFAGQRATTIACVASVSGDPRLDDALGDHARWLSRVVPDLRAWNQAIDPYLGLLRGGCDLGVRSWRDQARDGLVGLISEIIDVQGALNEQAPGYGPFVWDKWGTVAGQLDECGLGVPAAIDQRRDALLEWLGWISAPDGRITPVGDSYRTVTVPVEPGSLTEYTTSQGSNGTPPAAAVKVFDGGYVVGRDSWDDFADSTYWTLRFGPGRDLHGHEDHTAVTFWVDGHEVLVDSGHDGYRDSEFREALRSPEAHNVLTLPDVEFRIRRDTALVRSASGVGWRFDEVRDDVYSRQDGRFFDAPRTRGVLVAPDDGLMVVQDRATRSTAGPFEQLWHLVPGATIVSQTRSRVVARHPSGQIDIHVIQVPLPGQELLPGATTVVEGQLDPILGWYSESDGGRVPAPVVRMRRTGTETRMVTVITTTPVGGSVSTTPRLASRGWVVDVGRQGATRTIGISNDGAMRIGQPLESGPVLAGGLLRVPVSGEGGVPSSGVSAVALNVTAVRAGAPGYLTVYPCGSSRPPTSSVNYQVGGAWPNGVVVPVDDSGEVCVWSFADADVIVDVAGWFGDGVGQATDRLVDTRND